MKSLVALMILVPSIALADDYTLVTNPGFDRHRVAYEYPISVQAKSIGACTDLAMDFFVRGTVYSQSYYCINNDEGWIEAQIDCVNRHIAPPQKKDCKVEKFH